MSLMQSLIRPTFVHGVDIIQAVQKNFGHWEYTLLQIAPFTGIWAVYFIFFPIIYYMNMRMGMRILWSACITQYTAVMFKQVLHGHRPYWWVYESPYHVVTPRVRQFPGTCQTTPGSPSSSVMVMACMLFILVHHLCKCRGWTPNCQRTRYACAWGGYYTMLAISSIIQIFKAAHFPHQCALAVLMGNMMARRFTRTNVLSISFPGFVWMMFFMLASYSMLVGGLWVVGFDPTWAGSKAVQCCQRAKWIDIFSNVQIEDIIKASAMLFGLGLSCRFFTNNAIKVTDGCLPRVKLVHMCVGITFINIFDQFVAPPRGVSVMVYYVFLFCKYTIPPILIITDIPFISGVSKVISSGIVDEDLSCLAPLEGNAFPVNEDCGCVPMPETECWTEPEPDPACQPRDAKYNYSKAAYRRYK